MHYFCVHVGSKEKFIKSSIEGGKPRGQQVADVGVEVSCVP